VASRALKHCELWMGTGRVVRGRGLGREWCSDGARDGRVCGAAAEHVWLVEAAVTCALSVV